MECLEPDSGKRITLKRIISDVWVTENSRRPLLPLPSEVVPHEVRQKVCKQTRLCSSSIEARYLTVESISSKCSKK